MKIKKIINVTIIVLCLCLVSGVGVFIYDAQSSYNISSDFVSVPLKFNPDDSTSTYQTSNAQITVYGGFVKVLQKGKDGAQSVVIRALSPLPKITVKGDSDATISL
ncbi:MAG: metallophosphoesterase, partial [Clostridiaceae bacterium]|nr:metallophosphoesterase [Clostridiaceae bacterium]